MQTPFRNNFLSEQKAASALTRLPPAFVAFLVQLLALCTMLLLVTTLPLQKLNTFEWAVLQGLTAATISYQLKMPIWWLPIHLVFTPALVATLALALSPLWFLGAFLVIALIFGKTYQTQVPLYLSSQAAARTLASLLPNEKNFSFIDLGCGCGGLLNNLSKIRPKGNFHGIEAAPIPFLLGKLQAMVSTPDKTIRWGNFWKHNLSSYDIVYAYLSPVPMHTLWHKACREMRPGSILISNSFTIPGVKPEKILELNDFTGSTLYIWRINENTE
jgi:hypothetical protein